MNAAEIRGLPEKELLAKAAELRERLFRLSFKGATEPITNPAEVTELRRDAARIEGVLSEQKRGNAPRPRKLSREVRLLRSARAQRQKLEAARKAETSKAAETARQRKQAEVQKQKMKSGAAPKPAAGVVKAKKA